ncbi:unnamed protein product [Linum trigynum]|uniref:Secreted protein n=1 Tax=Linum trigynum TaxID=586398 RepID=A0AAV2CKL2_9ROSI
MPFILAIPATLPSLRRSSHSLLIFGLLSRQFSSFQALFSSVSMLISIDVAASGASSNSPRNLNAGNRSLVKWIPAVAAAQVLAGCTTCPGRLIPITLIFVSSRSIYRPSLTGQRLSRAAKLPQPAIVVEIPPSFTNFLCRSTDRSSSLEVSFLLWSLDRQ